MRNPYHKFIDILSESKEFEQFLSSHEDLWDKYERASQVKRVPGMAGSVGPVARPFITRDDFGGAQVIQSLRRSQRPEAELDRLIQQSYANGDRERGAKLDDFRKEFQLQRGEIQSGFRKDFENIQKSYDLSRPTTEKPVVDANTGDLMRDGPQQYMTPIQSLEAQAAAMGGGDARTTLRKNADGSISAQVTGNAGGAASAAGRQVGENNVRAAFRDRLSSLRSSNSDPGLLRQMDQLNDRFSQVDKMSGDERTQARKQWDQQARTLMNQASRAIAKPEAQVSDPWGAGEAPGATRQKVQDYNQSQDELRTAQGQERAAASAAQEPTPFQRTLTDREREQRANDARTRPRGAGQTPSSKQAQELGLQYGGGSLYYDRETGQEYKTIDGQLTKLDSVRRLPWNAKTQSQPTDGTAADEFMANARAAAQGDQEKQPVSKSSRRRAVIKPSTTEKGEKASTTDKKGEKGEKTSKSSGRSGGSGGGFKKAVSPKARRVEKDKRERVNPFSKRQTKDPNLESQLEMASKRVSGIKKQLKDLIDQIKSEKNPVIKERLIKKLAALDRQLGTAYVALERIKGVSGLTTSVGGSQFEQLRDMFRDTEKMSIEASNFTGKKPAVWTEADSFQKQTGKTSSLDDFFKDTKGNQDKRFANIKKDAESARLNSKPDIDADAIAKEINDMESEDSKESEIDTTVPEELMNGLFYMSDDEQAAKRDAEVEAAREKVDWDKKWFDPYEGETSKEKKLRLKREKAARRTMEAADKTMEPLFDKASQLSPSNDNTTAYFSLVGLYEGLTTKARQSIKKHNLFAKPKERDYYSDKHVGELTASIDKLDTGGGSNESVSNQLFKALESVGKDSNLSESEKVIALAVVQANARETTGGLEGNKEVISKWGKQFVEALKNVDGRYVYEREESKSLFSNLMYLVKNISRDYEPTKGNNDRDVLNGIRTSGENKRIKQVWMMRDDILRKSGLRDGVDSALSQLAFDVDLKPNPITGEKKQAEIKARVGRGPEADAYYLAREMAEKTPDAAVGFVDQQIDKALKADEKRKDGLEKARKLNTKDDSSVPSVDDQMKDFLKGVESGQIKTKDDVTRGDIPEHLIGIGLAPMLYEKVMNQRVQQLMENGLWAKYMRQTLRQNADITESVSFNSGGKAGTLMHQLINDDLNFLWTEEGYDWTLNVEQVLSEMNPDNKLRYKLAESSFVETNRFHVLGERVGLCIDAAFADGDLVEFPTNPFSREVLKEERSSDQTGLYQALIDVSYQSLTETRTQRSLDECADGACGSVTGGGGYDASADAEGPEAGFDMPLVDPKPKRRKQAKPSSRKKFSLKDIKEKYSGSWKHQ